MNVVATSEGTQLKARSKAQKLARRRGRPKLENVAREANGRVSRSGINREPIDRLAISARMKMHNLTELQAKDQRGETFIGILAMRGTKRGGITEAQYQAILQFVSARHDFQRAILAPNALLDNKARGSSGDEVSDGYIEWAKGARQRYEAARKAVEKADKESRRPIWPAFHICVVDDRHDNAMVPCLAILGDALVEHFGSARGRVDTKPEAA